MSTEKLISYTALVYRCERLSAALAVLRGEL